MNNSQGRKMPMAVIGFSDSASPLEPLWPSTHRALIPVAGKAVIVHLIEQLVRAGIHHVRIAGSIQQFAVRKRLGNGCEWGITIRYSDLHGGDLRLECLASSGECLYMLGDEFHHADLAAVTRPDDTRGVIADLESQTGLWRLRSGRPVRYSLCAVSATETYSRNLASVRDYHLANIRAARGLLPALNLPGSNIHEHAIADWKSDVASDAFIGAGIFIGKHSKVGKLGRLEGDCVLANGVVVQSGARLKNVSVLPNCFVGRSMSIRDAVLGPQGYFSLDGQFWPVDDPAMLAPTRDNQEHRTGIPSLRIA